MEKTTEAVQNEEEKLEGEDKDEQVPVDDTLKEEDA